MESIKIVEVGARDGLQNENLKLSIEDRVEFLCRLSSSGLRHLEAGSFVSAKAIPAMVDSESVWEAFPQKDSAELSFLVANEKGLERALKAGVKRIALFTATSEAFLQKNIRSSLKDSLKTFEEISKSAIASGISIRGYVSTVFGCPYEGRQSPGQGIEIAERLFEMGCDEVSIGDTIGVARPKEVRDFFKLLESALGLSRVAAHLHDTRGMAMANMMAALESGVRIFDSSVGGLGGCPYAQGASGNVATEEVVYCLEAEGISTGVSLPKLFEAASWIQAKLGKPLSSKLFLAGLPKKL
jgi:hydroxymethylglutaryl-CoA lyase